MPLPSGNEKKTFSLKRRLKSFSYAFQGVGVIWKEHNFRIHMVAALAAIFGGWWLSVSSLEWIVIIFAIAMVFTAEAFNTAIEYICNFISPQYHQDIKNIKDVTALAVLFLALASLLAGLIIFIPKIWLCLHL